MAMRLAWGVNSQLSLSRCAPDLEMRMSWAAQSESKLKSTRGPLTQPEARGRLRCARLSLSSGRVTEARAPANVGRPGAPAAMPPLA